MTKPAVVLLSGGLDSATCLAIARDQGYDCYALSFNYHQRHLGELQAAAKLASKMGAVEHRILELDLAGISGSALTDMSVAVPEGAGGQLDGDIPVTYVPARNTVFLSLALGWAEVLEARDIFIGVNTVDYSGYPDCRPEFIEAFERTANLATKAGVRGLHFTIHTPLIQMNKAQIIKTGLALGVDYADTISCYQADDQGRACGQCDSCYYRRQGFEQAGVSDPTRYY